MENKQALPLTCIVAADVNATDIVTSIDFIKAEFAVARIDVFVEAFTIAFVDIIKGLAQIPMQVATVFI